MQTFLPYPSYLESAKCLDRLRLGKQRIEAKEILLINLHLLNPQRYNLQFLSNYNMPKWRIKRHINHPCVLMWQSNLFELCIYGLSICQEWMNRGYKDNQHLVLHELLKETLEFPQEKLWFIGNEDFHNSHKSNLLRKDFNFYSKYNWNVVITLPYLWRE